MNDREFALIAWDLRRATNIDCEPLSPDEHILRLDNLFAEHRRHVIKEYEQSKDSGHIH